MVIKFQFLSNREHTPSLFNDQANNFVEETTDVCVRNIRQS